MIKLKLGPGNPNEKDDDDEPKNGWVAFWQTFGWVVFVLACLTYCCRAEIVAILQ